MADPYRTDMTIEVRVDIDLAMAFMADQMRKPRGKRPVLSLTATSGDVTYGLGDWQIEKVGTVHDSAGYDEMQATLRRVLT